MRRVIVSEYLMQDQLDRLGSRFDVVYDPDLYTDRPRLLDEARGAEAILIRNRTQIDAELLSVAPGMRVIGRLGVGLDNIDLDACTRSGVEVIPARGANAVSVAEYVMGAILHLTRGVFTMTGSMVEGHWPRQGHAFGREIMGKTIGLIGFGSIARQVAKRAVSFDMKVIAYDPYVPREDEAWNLAQPVDFTGLLETADVVSVHASLSDETTGLIDADAISRMKPDSILINTSRGGIVDERAVADGLRSGTIAGAALDVFAVEPLGPGPAEVFEGLDNLILTPHVAGNTHESVDRVATVIVDAVMAALGV